MSHAIASAAFAFVLALPFLTFLGVVPAVIYFDYTEAR